MSRRMGWRRKESKSMELNWSRKAEKQDGIHRKGIEKRGRRGGASGNEDHYGTQEAAIPKAEEGKEQYSTRAY